MRWVKIDTGWILPIGLCLLLWVILLVDVSGGQKKSIDVMIVKAYIKGKVHELHLSSLPSLPDSIEVIIHKGKENVRGRYERRINNTR